MKSKMTHPAAALMLAVAVTAILGACSSKEAGPAQSAGRKIDNATERLGEKMQDAGQEMQEKARGD